MVLNDTSNVDLRLGGYNTTGGYKVAPINPQQYGNGPGILYMPEKSLDTLFTKLYLLNETVPGFTEIFTDGLPQDTLLSIDNQVLTNINVYRINYTVLSQYNLLNQTTLKLLNQTDILLNQTQKCSLSTSAINYCANLSYLPAIFGANNKFLVTTPITVSPTS